MNFLCRRFYFWPIALLLIALLSGAAYARDLKISMAYLPDILESPDKGVFVDLVKGLDDVYEGTIQRGVYPFPRSIENVISGKADFHLPMIRNKLVSANALPYAYSTDKMGDVCFVIYSNKDNPITAQTIQQAKSTTPFPLKVETSGGFSDYFNFPANASIAVDSALKKVNVKRIDAFIFAQEECDYTIKQLKLKNIHRELYDKFDDVFIIPKGPAGKEIDAILSACLSKIRATGTLEKLHRAVHLDYQKWQPAEMGW
jgi:polar amino acid transport system substrate-binding protein